MAKDAVYSLLFYDPYDQGSEIGDKVYSITNHICKAPNVVPPHYHPEYEIILPESIEGNVVVEGKIFPLANDHLYCFYSRQPHAFNMKPNGEGKLTVFLFNSQVFDQFFSHFEGYEKRIFETEIARLPVVVKGEREKQLHELIFELSFFYQQRDQKTAWPQKAITELKLLDQILALLFSRDAKEEPLEERSDSKIQRIVDVVSNYIEHPGTLDEIARDCLVSKHHLCRIFKEHTGMTILAYLHKLRVLRAKYLMAEQDQNVTEACYNCGFSNVTNFIQVFTKYVGKTPKQWLLSQESKKEGAQE